VFSPSWWFHHYGITFNESFYLDAGARIRNDVNMRRALWERFEYGSAGIQPRPVIGSRHVAGGFVIPALLGVPIRFTDDQAPWPVPLKLDRAAAIALQPPAIESMWPVSDWLAQAAALRQEYGYVTGDWNTGGLLNTALEIRGEDFFADLIEDPELCDHLLDTIARTQVAVATLNRRLTGTCSVATNRSITAVDASIYLQSNCSAHMISPRLYEKRVLPFERYVAESLRPYGVHHCGANLHKYTDVYTGLGSRFFDVGWGSDAGKCSRDLPDAFLNLRMSPVRMLQCAESESYEDTLNLLRACGRRRDVGVCCINMDAGTPDSNVHAMFDAVRDFENAG
jgi:hypothetical protein